MPYVTQGESAPWFLQWILNIICILPKVSHVKTVYTQHLLQYCHTTAEDEDGWAQLKQLASFPGPAQLPVVLQVLESLVGSRNRAKKEPVPKTSSTHNFQLSCNLVAAVLF